MRKLSLGAFPEIIGLESRSQGINTGVGRRRQDSEDEQKVGPRCSAKESGPGSGSS